MKLYSTNDSKNIVSLREAVLQSLPKDKGLYMPIVIERLPSSFFDHIEDMSFQEIALEVGHKLIGDYIPKSDFEQIIKKSIDFPAPVVMHDDQVGTLELWHGPSLAFKDFGARFMAQLMAYFLRESEEKTTILVATSGDTGGAVAAGFLDTPGIEVIILYPSGKVSALQEKQLTTLGKNISAVEIDGTFDDCQAIVKTAFLDDKLNEKYTLSSANSINIARLIPQAFYYFEAYKQVKKYNKKVVVSVPSGNFGNLTAGLIAKRMGLPIHKFLAATNINSVVPEYLETGIYTPRPSESTISNAMDVGAPSNFVRMKALYDGDVDNLRKDIAGHFIDDTTNKQVMIDIYDEHNYVADPHGAIGYSAIKEYQKANPDALGIYLETAHPAKFLDVMDDTLPIKIDIPQRLKQLEDKKKVAVQMDIQFDTFREWMLNR